MKKAYRYIIGIALVFVLIFVVLYRNDFIGAFESKIESEARKAHEINESQQVSKSISYPMGVLLFYDTESNDITYSIYLNRKGFSFGYFYRSGGSRSEINEGILELHYKGYGSALLSMNKAKIERIEIDNGQEVKVISIDSEKPFTLVLSENSGVVTIYDINNNPIPISAILVND